MQSHIPKAAEGLERAAAQMEVPASSINVQGAISWLEESKAHMQPIEADVKDAKRRISAVKGPKKKRRAEESACEEESSEGEASG